MGERGDQYIVFGLQSCPFCQEAVDLLGALGYNYDYYRLDDNPEYLQELKEFYNHRTVPIVVRIGQQDSIARFVGGCDDLKREIND